MQKIILLLLFSFPVQSEQDGGVQALGTHKRGRLHGWCTELLVRSTLVKTSTLLYATKYMLLWRFQDI